ncbi:MAG: NADP-dependent malic enzyme [Angelakisella sp.]|nr:NADP-dependent malic enzyme [Angelakisella sp.]
MDAYEKALALHERHKGKLTVASKVPVENADDLSLAYTPGVAAPCLAIAKEPNEVYRYTCKGNLVAVITDGSAVLGLGNIGPKAALPVMEGKSVLFKRFGGVDAVPICLDTQDTEEIITAIKNLAPAFGGINLEDIAAPRCFEIERRVQELVDIPVFHDDQHGTAIVNAAALINAAKVVDKPLETLRVVVNGAGSAGTAIAKMLLRLGVGELTVCDRQGIVNRENAANSAQRELIALTGQEGRSGSLADALQGADVFVGVSAPKLVTREMVASMAPKAIVFPMANPEPEIFPEEALAGGAAVVGTGRSDFPNQINNVLAFPGIFRGALDVRASRITPEMMLAAAYAIAEAVPEEKRSAHCIIPSIFEPGISQKVAEAVGKAWTEKQK